MKQDSDFDDFAPLSGIEKLPVLPRCWCGRDANLDGIQCQEHEDFKTDFWLRIVYVLSRGVQ